MRKTLENIKAEVFNGIALEADAPVFIAYGLTEAQAIQKVENAPVISLNSVSPDDFAAALSGDSARFIIAYPAGVEGEAKAGELESVLNARGISCFRADPGVLYMEGSAAKSYAADPGIFASMLSFIRDEAIKIMDEARMERYRKRVKGGDDLIAALKERIQNRQTGINTGFKLLNAALGDGLPPGLVVIGAIPSLGKTTFSLQIADCIASQRIDVLYIALEQSAPELASKSLSRMSWKPRYDFESEAEYHARKDNLRLTDLDIRQYQHKERIDRMIERYAAEIAPNMFICTPREPTTPDDIANLVKAHISARGRAPVLVVDYLQILAPQNIRYTEKQANDYAALKLKTLAEDIKMPVICISSFNRMNYAEDVGFQAFKESGGIEYGADVVIGVQLYGTGTLKGKVTIDPDEEKKKNPRRIEIKILKNRGGAAGRRLYYNYYADASLFCEVNGPYYTTGAAWEDPVYKETDIKQRSERSGTQENEGSKGGTWEQRTRNFGK